jgi:hypothetical protein
MMSSAGFSAMAVSFILNDLEKPGTGELINPCPGESE